MKVWQARDLERQGFWKNNKEQKIVPKKKKREKKEKNGIRKKVVEFFTLKKMINYGVSCLVLRIHMSYTPGVPVSPPMTIQPPCVSHKILAHITCVHFDPLPSPHPTILVFTLKSILHFCPNMHTRSDRNHRGYFGPVNDSPQINRNQSSQNVCP